MIICSHCHHQNSDEASQCEACCSELSTEASCPGCGQSNQYTARFCGHCGFLLEDQLPDSENSIAPPAIRSLSIPEPLPPDPVIDIHGSKPIRRATSTQLPGIEYSQTAVTPGRIYTSGKRLIDSSLKAALIHEPTQFRIQLEQYQFPVHLGKPNRKVMPDVDLATFKNSEVVSRIHADIQIKDNEFFIQDNGSANGTFVNNKRIRPGQVQLLASGDKISLGKGDLMTFIFDLS